MFCTVLASTFAMFSVKGSIDHTIHCVIQFFTHCGSKIGFEEFHHSSLGELTLAARRRVRLRFHKHRSFCTPCAAGHKHGA